MNTSSPQTPPAQPVNAFAHQAAKASWVCAVVVFGLVMFGSRTGAQVVIELVALLLMITGLILGIVALAGIPRHGAKGVRAPALVGIIINSLLIFIFVTNYMAARASHGG